MTFKLPENVQETTTTTGTGAVALLGEVAGADPFSSQMANNDTTIYRIQDTANTEIGVGTFTDVGGDQLSRDIVLYSTNGDALVNWTTGIRNVAIGPSGTIMQNLIDAYAVVAHSVVSGTGAGSMPTTTWNPRTLNTIKKDPSGIISLGSNQITLTKGRYRCRIIVPGYNVGAHKARLQNITDASTELLGLNSNSGSLTIMTNSVIEGDFTITATKVFEVQHYHVGAPTDAWGTAVSAPGVTEEYLVAEFWKLH